MTRPRLDPLLTFADTVLAARDWVAERLFGPRCAKGCGQRIYPKDVAAHDDLDHAGDPT